MNTIIQKLARQHVLSLPAYNAGLSANHVRSKYQVENVVKLASNENPFGASPRVMAGLAALEPSIISLYPEADCSELRQMLMKSTGIAAEHIVVGNGSESLIAQVCLAFLNSGDNVLTITPSFGLHMIFPQLCKANVLTVPLTRDMEFDAEALIHALQTNNIKILMFSNPSNPAGCMLNQTDLKNIIAAAPADCLLVIDEAYYEYAVIDNEYPDSLSILQQQDRPWLVLRTLSKAYGLAGLRIGYGLCYCAELANLLQRVASPFSVNAIAQMAARLALQDTEHVSISVNHVLIERQRISMQLQELGLQVAPSHANFLFFKLPTRQSALVRKLLTHGVVIKGWGEVGYADWARVSIGSVAENNQFLQAVRAELLSTGNDQIQLQHAS